MIFFFLALVEAEDTFYTINQRPHNKTHKRVKIFIMWLPPAPTGFCSLSPALLCFWPCHVWIAGFVDIFCL